jgi:hypothetical protein
LKSAREFTKESQAIIHYACPQSPARCEFQVQKNGGLVCVVELSEGCSEIKNPLCGSATNLVCRLLLRRRCDSAHKNPLWFGDQFGLSFVCCVAKANQYKADLVAVSQHRDAEPNPGENSSRDDLATSPVLDGGRSRRLHRHGPR